MKRLSKLENEFIVVGKWYVRIETYGSYPADYSSYREEDDEEEEQWEDIDESYEELPKYAPNLDDAISIAKDEFSDCMDIIQEQCQDECSGDEQVLDLEFDLDENYSYMKVKCNKEFSEETKEKIKNIILGQYSDGVGEGLEQHAYLKERDTDYADGDVTSEYFVQLWRPNTELKIQ